MPRSPLTSVDNPLRIAELRVGDKGGMVGITFAPGKQQSDALSGWHQRDLAADLDLIAGWNASAVVTLVETHELDALGITRLGQEVRLRHMEWHHWPIRDFDVPDVEFEAAWPDRSSRLRSLLARGNRVLIHCKGGLGRAGMISARLLAEQGLEPAAALEAVRRVRPGAVETTMQSQWVSAGRPTTIPPPASDRRAACDRAVGALVGLAVGDAVGAAIEFTSKPRLALLDDMMSGGPHRLQRGQWTDDTAMALALADSLLHDPGLDAADLMRRFADWHEQGTYSCTGECFDIGNATRAALDRFRRSGNPLAGSADEQASGNGALMRLSPVAIRHWQDRDELRRVAELQTRTTHGSVATMEASRTFATLLADAISGMSLPDVLCSPTAEAARDSWRGRYRDQIHGSGYVVKSLQAAIWAVSRSTNFRSAILLAANLGEDADTTAAIAGQLAGAVYGASGIPQDWLDALAWRERLEQAGRELFDAGYTEVIECKQAALGNEFSAPWMTLDWTLRERLAALAGFRPAFERDGLRFSGKVPPHRIGDMTVLGGTDYSENAMRFIQVCYDYGWVRVLPWSQWQDTERGRRLMQDPRALAKATDDDLACIITTCMRADRFCEGYMASAFESGLITRVIARAGALLDAIPPRRASPGRRRASGPRTGRFSSDATRS